MLKLLLRILFDERGVALSVTRPTANTLITAAGFASRYTEIEAVVNALDGNNIEDDAIDKEHIAVGVVRANYGLIQHTDGSLYVDVSDTNSCLEITDGGVRVKVDDSTITRTAAGLVSSSGVTDHGALTGLIDDDHSIYLNETRHDADDHSSLSVTQSMLSGYAESFGTDGYVKLTGGLTIMWGEDTVDGETAITFPTSFSNACYQVIAAGGTDPAGLGTNTANIHAYDITTSGCNLYASPSQSVRWWAVGY